MSNEGDLVLRLHGAELQELPGKVAAVTLHTSRGDIQALLHPGEHGRSAVVWAGGANGDMNGPAGGLFADLAGDLAPLGISSLRVRYRKPHQFYEGVLDVLAGVSFLKGLGAESLVLVGHSQGGAVAIMAGVLSEQVKAVAALAPQGYGTHLVHQLAPRPLLLVHGDADEVCRPEVVHAIYRDAGEPKRLVCLEGAGHTLLECRQELTLLLSDWVIHQLGAPPRDHATGPLTVVRPLIVDDGSGPRLKELVLYQGDITCLECDAIVCPNNDQLWVTEGVAGAILRRAGESVLRQALAVAPAPVGSCVVTSGGSLPARYVLHAVTSGMLNGLVAPSPETICAATRSCFARASELGLRSIAFPAIGAGAAGLPFEAVAAVLLPVIVEELRRAPTVEKVVIALFGPGAFHAFASRLERLLS
jgi:O-acetyl-ADP-ribose deacetylase (regulator of RNase III)/alpha/beta superfamily hydrolase